MCQQLMLTCFKRDYTMQSNWKENQRLFNVIQSWFKRDLEIDKRDSNMIQHDSNVIQRWFKLDSTWFKGDIGGITRDWNSIKCAIQSWLKLNLTWLKTWFKLDSNLISDSIVIQTLFKRDTGPSGEEIVIQTWFGRNSCNFKTKRQLIVISRGLELETSFRLVQVQKQFSKSFPATC